MSEERKRKAMDAIPESWAMVSLAELLTAGPKNGYSGRSAKDAQGTPTLSLGATTSGCLLLNEDTVKRLIETIDPKSDLFLRPGDVLVQRSNTSDLVGMTAIFDGPAGVFAYPDLMMRLRFRHRETAHWFWRYANSSNGRKFFSSTAAGSSGSMPKISGEKLRAMQIPLPPTSEQRAATSALSEVDALLAGLDRLIAKKRDLKQAAMQQLLTGQSRLPGFESKWAEVRLRDLGTVYGGLTGKTKADFGSGTDLYVTFVNVMSNVTIDPRLFEQVRVGPMESQNLVKSGDLLFNGSSETPEEVAMCSLVSGEIEGRLFLNSFCFGFRLHSGAETDALFLTYYLRSREGRELMKSLAQGSTRYNLSKGALLDSVLHLPSKAEQAAIAVVLNEMDAGLFALEARLRKTRSLKQAMMQELLTGRIRLI